MIDSAKVIFSEFKYQVKAPLDGLDECEFNEVKLYLSLKKDEQVTFHGYYPLGEKAVDEGEIFFFEGLCRLLNGQEIKKIMQIQLRELEAFCRKNNRETIFLESGPSPRSGEEVWEENLTVFKRKLSELTKGEEYSFDADKEFKSLSYSQKIKELEEYFSSKDLAQFREYQGEIKLVEIEDLNVFLELHCQGIDRESFLDWLSLRTLEVFREPRLNLILEN